MEGIIEFIINNPSMAAILLLIAIILGLIHIAIVVFEKFGIFGNKHPTLDEILREVKTTQNNHLHELPDMVKKIDKIEIKLDKVLEGQIDFGQRLVRVETLLDVNIK